MLLLGCITFVFCTFNVELFEIVYNTVLQSDLASNGTVAEERSKVEN